LAVSAILAVSVARVIWRDSLAKIADTKIIGIGIDVIHLVLSIICGLDARYSRRPANVPR
jgi:hypothetical protein